MSYGYAIMKKRIRDWADRFKIDLRFTTWLVRLTNCEYDLTTVLDIDGDFNFDWLDDWWEGEDDWELVGLVNIKDVIIEGDR